MDFGLNEEQEMMQALARDFMKDEFPEKVLRAVTAGDQDMADGLWKKMVEMNLMGLSVPEEYGGLGDVIDLCVVLEEMGKACFISPFYATVALGVSTIVLAGTDEQKQQYLPDIAEGKSIVTLAMAEEKAGYTADDIKLKAETAEEGFLVNGTKRFVPDAAGADYIICAARTGGAGKAGVSLFIVPGDAEGLTVTPMQTVSGEKLYCLEFENVKLAADTVLGNMDAGWNYLEKVMQYANVTRCAYMVGLAQQALQLTLDYTKERIAFGHPIGAFQSIQHRCADMLIDVDSSRFVTYQAAWRLAKGLPAEREVAIAKAWVSKACTDLMHSAHQAHGAIGFTEDHILHFYTKMTRACEFAFGGADYHLEKLAALS